MIKPEPATSAPLAPFLIRNFILPLFIYTDKSLIRKFKLFQIIRYTIITVFLFFLKIIPSSLKPDSNRSNNNYYYSDSDGDQCYYPYVPFFKEDKKYNRDDGTDTCIARALTQLLAIVNEIPVSSRKYEVVRSYAEKLMDENLEEGNESLRKVNATVLSCAFSRTLGQLELAAVAAGVAAGVAAEDDGSVVVNSGGGGCFGLNRVMKTVGRYGDVAWTRFRRRRMNRFGGSAEKLAAELLWLAEKFAACGSSGEAVGQWASASKLASVALSAQPRLQGSLVKLSVFLFKQAASMGGEDTEEDNVEELRKVKMEMLMSWLPFLCRASIGTDAPVLSVNEKIEVENVLGELIASLKHEDEQEKVLSLWLHHFTRCASSDWPNLHLYYTSWCTTSRKLLILEGK